MRTEPNLKAGKRGVARCGEFDPDSDKLCINCCYATGATVTATHERSDDGEWLKLVDWNGQKDCWMRWQDQSKNNLLEFVQLLYPPSEPNAEAALGQLMSEPNADAALGQLIDDALDDDCKATSVSSSFVVQINEHSALQGILLEPVG